MNDCWGQVVNTRTERWAGASAKIYAALVCSLGLVFLFVGLVFSQTHVAESAPYLFLPGIILVVLGAFIWRGYRWAMILAAACIVVLAVMIVREEPSYFSLSLIVAVLFAILALFSLLNRPRV
jgi:hypothetical protein